MSFVRSSRSPNLSITRQKCTEYLEFLQTDCPFDIGLSEHACMLCIDILSPLLKVTRDISGLCIETSEAVRPSCIVAYFQTSFISSGIGDVTDNVHGPGVHNASPRALGQSSNRGPVCTLASHYKNTRTTIDKSWWLSRVGIVE